MFVLHFKYVCIFIAFYVPYTSCDISEISLQHMDIFTERISKKLTTMFHKVSGYNEFEQGYKRLENEKIFIIKERNVSEVNEKFATGLKKLFNNAVRSLRNIKKHAEDLHSKYKYNPDIEPQTYLHERNIPANPAQLEPTFSLSSEVNFNTSFLQTPVNVYNQSKEILNDVEWTKSLDETFIQNFKRDPTLLWQYFGSETGMIRTYPGKNFIGTNDTFDCRKRVWYTETTASSKDMVIALDMSGSMSHQNKFGIAKIIMQSILQTFYQNDFFNIIYFNETINYAIPCAKSLIQATPLNKNIMIDTINDLPKDTPGGLSNAGKGLTTAFKILNENNKNMSNSSDCNKVIMLISDGIDNNDELDDVIRIYNADCSVVIFSFIVGDDARNGLRKLACGNGGKFYSFKTLGSVWDDGLKYQQVLSHPKALANDDHVTFTPIFLDAGNQGLIITLCVGILGKKDKHAEFSLLGVAGTDVAHKLLERAIPYKELGVFGHGIAINNNGILLIHPSLSHEHRESLLSIPGASVTIYLHQVERAIDKKKIDMLQRNMIDGKTGCFDAEIHRVCVVGKTERPIRLNVTYCYAPITDTPFSAGISMPLINQMFQSISLKLTDEIYSAGISALKPTLKDVNVEISNWIFCDIPAALQYSHPAVEMFYPTALELYNYLNSSETNTTDILQKCDLETLNYLLITGELVSNITNTVWSSDRLFEMGILSIYIMTSSGYMSTIGENSNLSRSMWTEELFLHPVAYQTAYGNRPLLVFTVVFSNRTKYNTSRYDITNEIAVGMSYHTNSYNKAPTAIIGIRLPLTTLKLFLYNNIEDKVHFSFDCEKRNIFSCHFIDENAIIVVSNQDDKEVGQFFGKINGILMEKLLENSTIFKRMEFETTRYKLKWLNAAKSCSSIVQNTYQILWKCVHSFVLYILSILVSFISVFGTETQHNGEGFDLVINRSFIFVRTKEFINQSGIVPCNQSYAIQSIRNTNLVMIVVMDNCNEKFYNYPLRTEEEDRGHSTCRIKSHTSYRLPLPNCHKLRCNHSECDSPNYKDESLDVRSNLIALGFIFFLTLVFLGMLPMIKKLIHFITLHVNRELE